ncbi:hypothetical protein IWQ61_009963 [Dispira simplex]|nr:hypothetical protein IWQ61_009963 [Dispira simplex]
MAHLPPESRPPPEDIQKHWAENHVKIALWEAMAFQDYRKAQRQLPLNPQTRRHTVTHVNRTDLPISSPAKSTTLHPHTPRRRADHSSVSNPRQGSNSSKTPRNTTQSSLSTSRHYAISRTPAKSSDGESPLQLPAQAMQSAFTGASNDPLLYEGPQSTAKSHSRSGSEYTRVASGFTVNQPTRRSSTIRQSDRKEIPLTVQFDLQHQEARGSGRHRSSQSTKIYQSSTKNKGRKNTVSYSGSPPPQVTSKGNGSRKYHVASHSPSDTPQTSLIHYDFKATDEINSHFNLDEMVHKGPLHVTNFQPGDLDSLRSRDSSPFTLSPTPLTPLTRSPLSTAQLLPTRSHIRPSTGIGNNTNRRIPRKENNSAVIVGSPPQHYHQPITRAQSRLSGESSRRVPMDFSQMDSHQGPWPHNKRTSTATFGTPLNLEEQRGSRPLPHSASGPPMRLPLFHVRQQA